MNQFWSGNECERAHTLTTKPQAPKTHKKRNQQSDKQSEQCSVPPKGPFLTDSWSWMKSSARQTLSNQQYQILLQGKLYSSKNQSNEMLVLCFVLK